MERNFALESGLFFLKRHFNLSYLRDSFAFKYYLSFNVLAVNAVKYEAQENLKYKVFNSSLKEGSNLCMKIYLILLSFIEVYLN